MRNGMVFSVALSTIGTSGILALCRPGELAGAVGERSAASDVSPTRMAIERALLVLAAQTDHWITKNKCASCHQVPFALWAMREARSAGIEVDERYEKWRDWSVQFVLRDLVTGRPDVEKATSRVDELWQQIVTGLAAESVGTTGAEYSRIVELLRVTRKDDGSWPAGGQLPDQKRPKKETDETTTMWSALALKSAGQMDEAAMEKSMSTVTSESSSLEHLAVRFLVAVDTGKKERVLALRGEIVSQQNDDGGWGWLLDGESDAMATGQALYALCYSRDTGIRDAIERGEDFLVRTQESSGAWSVPSTLRAKKGERYEVVNDWGTAWAVIGLVHAMNGREDPTCRVALGD